MEIILKAALSIMALRETTRNFVDFSVSALTRKTSWLQPASWLFPITDTGSSDLTITPLFSKPPLARRAKSSDNLAVC